MKSMYYLTQFVVSNITMETHAEQLSKLFMENVVLSFIMVAVFVVDTKSRFKSVFKDMCAALGIIYWPLELGNHKRMSIENVSHLSQKNFMQYQFNTEARMTSFSRMRKPLSTHGIVPQSTAQIFSDGLLLSVDISVSC